VWPSGCAAPSSPNPQLGTGQGLWRIKHRSFVVQHEMHPAKLEVFDTTARMKIAL
jgi:hypothetical protein